MGLPIHVPQLREVLFGAGLAAAAELQYRQVLNAPQRDMRELLHLECADARSKRAAAFDIDE